MVMLLQLSTISSVQTIWPGCRTVYFAVLCDTSLSSLVHGAHETLS